MPGLRRERLARPPVKVGCRALIRSDYKQASLAMGFL